MHLIKSIYCIISLPSFIKDTLKIEAKQALESTKWVDLLKKWSREVIDFEDYLVAPYQYGEPPPEVLSSGWLGYPGASEAQILEVEARLGVVLPPSYRTFLTVSNGWRQTTPSIYKLWSTEKIDWFSVRNQQWIDAYVKPASPYDSFSIPPISDEEYYVYGENQSSTDLRTEYLETALEISDVGDSAIYLLNPKVITEEGEWEAWYFANFLPGAIRYRSFWELMNDEHENYLTYRNL